MGTDVHKITETNLCPGKGPWHASFRQRDALVFYRMVTALEDNVNEDDGNYKSNEAPRPSLNTWDGSDSSTRHLLHPQADRNVEEGFREDDRAAKQASIFRDSIQRHIRRPRLIHPSPPPSTGGLQRGRGTPGRRRGRPDDHTRPSGRQRAGRGCCQHEEGRRQCLNILSESGQFKFEI